MGCNTWLLLVPSYSFCPRSEERSFASLVSSRSMHLVHVPASSSEMLHLAYSSCSFLAIRSSIRSDQLCGGLDLGQSLALLESSLLLESHNLEAVEVGQVLPPLDLVALLGPVALLPLGIDLVLFPKLLDNTVTGSTEEALDDELRKQALGEGDGLTRNRQGGVSGRTVDENLRKSVINLPSKPAL